MITEEEILKLLEAAIVEVSTSPTIARLFKDEELQRLFTLGFIKGFNAGAKEVYKEIKGEIININKIDNANFS